VGGGRTARGEEGALTPLHFPLILPRRKPGPIANRGEARGARNRRPQGQHLLQHVPRQAPRINDRPRLSPGKQESEAKKGKRRTKGGKSGSKPGTTKYLSSPAPAPSYSPTATTAEGRDRYRPAAWSSPVAPAVRGVTNRGRREAPQPAGRHYDRSPMMPRGAASRRVGRAAVSKARASGEKRSGPRRDSGIEDGPQENAARLPTPQVRRGEPEIATAGARWVPSNADCPPGTYRAPAHPRKRGCRRIKPRAPTRRGNANTCPMWCDPHPPPSAVPPRKGEGRSRHLR
jgi:hypothetical protein